VRFCEIALTIFAGVLRDYQHFPNINEAIGCYLGPAGMVYAIFFGFTYQAVTGRATALDEMINAETSAATMVLRMTLATPESVISGRFKLDIAKYCRDEMLAILDELFGDEPRSHEELLPGMQNILPLLHEVQEDLSNANVSKETAQLAAHQITKINDVVVATGPVADRRHQVIRSGISVVEWIFLQILGCCAFFGIMLVDCTSYRMNIVFCFITASTIIILML
jgi:hypothetical protein